MVISLTLIFLASLVLSFFEERLEERDKKWLYVILGVAMVLVSGMRDVHSTPDSDHYELMYYGKTTRVMEGLMEPTFTFLVWLLNALGLGVNALFFTYALISVPIHMALFRKMTNIPFTMLTIYLSYYFMMHEMAQIRAGVAAGCLLWAIYLYAEQKKTYALVAILAGTMFHYSAAAGLVLLLLGNGTTLPRWQKWALFAIVPVGLVAYFTHIDISYIIPEEMGGDKLMAYRELRDKGLEDEQAGWPLEQHLLIWLNIILYCCCIYYHDYLVKHFKYTTIAIKMQAVAFCFLFFLNGVSKVLGNRMCDLFSVVSIVLWTASVYAFTPMIYSKALSNFVSTIRFVTSAAAYALALLFL